MFEVIFDLETKKFFDDTGTSDPADLGVSIVSLYRRELDENFHEISGKLMSFWEKDIHNMWKFFLDADRIIGFNSLRFDVPALKPYAPANFSKLPHFDILDTVKEAFGHRASLNKIAKATLGELKIDSGENATIYFAKGDPESLNKLQMYCESDVMITKKVYDFGLANGYLNLVDYWNTERKITVDFSYAGTASFSAQPSLF